MLRFPSKTLQFHFDKVFDKLNDQGHLKFNEVFNINQQFIVIYIIIILYMHATITHILMRDTFFEMWEFGDMSNER